MPQGISLFVELRGIEPLTFSLRTRRATNCATAPNRSQNSKPVGVGPNAIAGCQTDSGVPLLVDGPAVVAFVLYVAVGVVRHLIIGLRGDDRPFTIKLLLELR